MARTRRRGRPGRYWYWPFLAPALVLVFAVVAIPLARAIYLSLTNYELLTTTKESFVGLRNFARALGDPAFRRALMTTLLFVATATVGSLAVGLGIAVLIEQLPPRLQRLRAFFIVPWVMPAVVVALLFLYMFDIQVSVVTFILSSIGLTSRTVGWLTTTTLAMAIAILATIWIEAPLAMLFSSAGLKAIPRELRDAAVVDGARGWSMFRHITLPLMRRVLLITALLLTIQNLNSFPLIWGLTQGGPVDATTTTVILVYRLAFQNFRFGYAAAVGVILLIATLIPAVIYARNLRSGSE
jgi:multiple sugar transport system permease protein